MNTLSKKRLYANLYVKPFGSLYYHFSKQAGKAVIYSRNIYKKT